MKNNDSDRNFINSLAKGLNVLMTFTKSHPKLTLSEVAKENDMNLPTARRYLHTLSELDFIIRDDQAMNFQLTPKVLRLGSWVLEGMELRSRLLPFMSDITHKLNVTTHCSILEGNEIVAIERLRSTDVVNLDIIAGTRMPCYATSMGKAILAYLDKEKLETLIETINFQQLTEFTIDTSESLFKDLELTRARGYAIASQELNYGLKTLAVPLFDKKGKVEASFGVSYPVLRAKEEGLESILIDKLLQISSQTAGE